MNEKQIDELKKDLMEIDKTPYTPNCTYNERRATKLYKKGWRKSATIAKQIFSEIEAIATPVKTGNIHILAEFYEELKNKYTNR